MSTFDNKLSFKAYVSAIVKKVYAKIGSLRGLKSLVLLMLH